MGDLTGLAQDASAEHRLRDATYACSERMTGERIHGPIEAIQPRADGDHIRPPRRAYLPAIQSDPKQVMS
ncbi:hypothetical protein M2302_003078 [Micromonospora sp. A200]|nr:hypothetical protein [Micromonospora sp. A200]